MENKEASDSSLLGIVTSRVSAITDLFFGSLYLKLKDEAYSLMESAEYKARAAQERLKREAMFLAAITIAGVFFLLTFLYFLIDYLNLPRTVSFLIIGLIGLIAALFIRSNNNEVKAYG